MNPTTSCEYDFKCDTCGETTCRWHPAREKVPAKQQKDTKPDDNWHHDQLGANDVMPDGKGGYMYRDYNFQ